MLKFLFTISNKMNVIEIFLKLQHNIFCVDRLNSILIFLSLDTYTFKNSKILDNTDFFSGVCLNTNFEIDVIKVVTNLVNI